MPDAPHLPAPHILAGDTEHPRDFLGYGPNPPDPRWPGGARLALSFVLNYEEGGENTVLNGDRGSEVYLQEVPGGTPTLGERAITVETQYDYGARAGVWRILRLFAERGLPLTIYAVGRALELNPTAARAFAEAGHEVASHGWRWIDYRTRARACGARRDRPLRRDDRADHRRPAGRLVHRPGLAAHPPAGRRARRLPLRQRQLWRRPAATTCRRPASRCWSCPIRSTTTT